MVVATKNKRGRPADKRYAQAIKQNNASGTYNPEVSERAVQNAVNAELLICLLIDTDNNEIYWFFTTSDGNRKHKGIAEQIGRMMREGMITDDQAILLADRCIRMHENGMPSKKIEKNLRRYRLDRKKAGATGPRNN